MKRHIFQIAIALLAAACAVIEPPSGGPEDRTAPFVVDISPHPDSTGIARDSDIEITFSEKLDGESFKNRIQLYPALEFERVKVKDERLEIRFRELMPETTICILLKAGFADQHRVRGERSYTYYFATSNSLEKGNISGSVLFKGKPDSTGVIKAFEISADTLIDFIKQPESRMAFSASDGQFSFWALPTDSSRFLLWAFIDRDGDFKCSGDKEFSLLYPDTIVLTENATTIEEIWINIIDPNEPGILRGLVVNMTGVDMPPTVRLDPLLPDERSIVSVADSTGNFVIGAVPPGGYIVTTFLDLKADSACGDYPQPEDSTIVLKEPCYTCPDTLIVEPGESKTLEPINLEKEGTDGR